MTPRHQFRSDLLLYRMTLERQRHLAQRNRNIQVLRLCRTLHFPLSYNFWDFMVSSFYLHFANFVTGNFKTKLLASLPILETQDNSK